MIVRVRDCTRNSPSTKWSVNLFMFLIHAHQKYVMNKTKILCGQLNCSIKLADVLTRCSSHPQGKSEARYEKLVLL